MSTSTQIAEWQTDNAIQWVMNDETTYERAMKYIDRHGKFNGASAKSVIKYAWGDRAPDGSGLSRVRWGEVASVLNDESVPGLRIGSIKRMNARIGHHFFSPDTMAFFNSVVYPNTRGIADERGKLTATLFVTSEQCDWGDHPRLYTVRIFDHVTCQIGTVGEFQQIRSLDVALSVMRGYSYRGSNGEVLPINPIADYVPDALQIPAVVSEVSADDSWNDIDTDLDRIAGEIAQLRALWE